MMSLGFFQLGPATAELVKNPPPVMMLSGNLIAFFVLSAMALCGGLFTIVQRNLVGAVMSLVASFFGLAGLYALLQAHFLAAVQVLVYAGAIMVLFIFVVMVLNRDETEPVAVRGLLAKCATVGAMVYLLSLVGRHLGNLKAKFPNGAPAEFGTVREVGRILFSDELFAFEAIALLLLIAVIAAVVVARSHVEKPPEEVV
jgi:NADH-quinone oxidoreductase subunit J